MAALDYKMLMKLERDAFLQEQKMSQQHHSNPAQNDGVDQNHLLPVKAEVDDGREWSIIHQDSRRTELIGDIPSMYYSPNSVSAEMEIALIEMIDSTGSELTAWKQLKARRLQCWGDFPNETVGNKRSDLSATMPTWLDKMIDSLVEQEVFSAEKRPNNVLINQYMPHEGIIHHTDGPAYHSRVAILSLNSTCIMSFRKKLSSEQIGIEFAGDVASVVLEPRSMFIFEQDAYTAYMHGIEIAQPVQIVGEQGPCLNLDMVDVPAEPDGRRIVTRGLRTSITFRCLRKADEISS